MASIEEVLQRNPNVRFAAIIGPGGKVLKGGMRPETESLEPASKAENLYLQWTTMHRSGQDWNKYLGRRTYLLDKRERVNIYTFNVDREHILLVSTDPISANTLGDQILEMLARNELSIKPSSKRRD
ncbi:MAG TPA: DUF6659 family protein [Nitrososphaerales archaeon]|nr:DUF6659 family protein [Nitrososphaerales archaeon]